ncbi:hypothetical protein K502DRAFT_344609 [Neoconidiobolus thromboides FSU 785]|nr:hypothetical protein K502DRAFT_344609 [Neoconidiobolus thromboides FSU 785]
MSSSDFEDIENEERKYEALSKLEAGKEANTIGIITRLGEIKVTKRDLSLRVSIIDSSLSKGEEITILFFRKVEQQFPKFNKVGDILISNGLKIQKYNQRIQVLSLLQSRHKLVDLQSNINELDLSDNLKQKLINLKQWYINLTQSSEMITIKSKQENIKLIDLNKKRSINTIDGVNEISITNTNALKKSNNYNSGNKLKLKKLSEVKLFEYIDLVAMVISIQHNTEDDHITLLLTDFTENELLEPKTLEYQNTFLYNKKYIVYCTLWDEHKLFIEKNKIQQHDILKFYNLRVKPNDIYGIELVLHGEKKVVSNKLVVIKQNDEAAIEILRRKQMLMPKKLKIKREQRESNEVEKKLTEIEYPNLPVVSLDYIMNDLEYPKMYHIHSKIVDIYPNDIKEFITFICDQCNAKIENKELVKCKKCGNEKDNHQEWKLEYQFNLVFENENINSGLQLPVIVNNEFGTQFFKFISAKEFKYNHLKRQELRDSLIKLCQFNAHYLIAAFKPNNSNQRLLYLLHTKIL